MKHYFKSTACVLTLIVCVVPSSLPLSVTAQAPKTNASIRKPQQPAPKVRFASGNSALKIPLEIDNNIILMRVSVNGSKPLKFIFDTGVARERGIAFFSMSFCTARLACHRPRRLNSTVRGYSYI
jgi:hypothetical protein